MEVTHWLSLVLISQQSPNFCFLFSDHRKLLRWEIQPRRMKSFFLINSTFFLFFLRPRASSFFHHFLLFLFYAKLTRNFSFSFPPSPLERKNELIEFSVFSHDLNCFFSHFSFSEQKTEFFITIFKCLHKIIIFRKIKQGRAKGGGKWDYVQGSNFIFQCKRDSVCASNKTLKIPVPLSSSDEIIS